MTRRELAELKALVEAATKGPWHVGFDDGSGAEDRQLWIVAWEQQDALGLNSTIVSGNDGDGAPTGVRSPADAAFIAAAREAVPRLIKQVDRLEAGIAQLLADHQRVHPCTMCYDRLAALTTRETEQP